ncbi:MAG TPA: hypothetical protein PKY66_16155 [Thermoflexales bacterium]|nr:hypothetical protein [Anaerolineae bacterium]HQV28803.1 hypothetical protein [Thermoflexales bacterium]HQX11953.1 hypothetical protein [Thermoflexales bacterium]HRA54119.1 hypothetical protein [Thermoflexales bacterium]
MYPAPDRSNYVPRRQSTTDDGSVDIGWDAGVLADGRSWRAEAWADSGMTILTFFFSTLGLELATDADLAALLAREGLIRYRTAPGRANGTVIDDAAGNPMWSVSVVIGTEDETQVEDTTRLRPY